MDDPMLSPDGNFLWSGAKWIPVHNQDSNPSEIWGPASTNNPHLNKGENPIRKQVVNMALVMIDNLRIGDMKGAKECWNRSKMLDISTTKEVFEREYAEHISLAYLQIAEVKLAEFKTLFDRAATVDIGFKVQVEMAPDVIKMALENSTAFVPGNLSFQYNLLYAKMWMYCKRFDLIWVRSVCEQEYVMYYNRAHDLAVSNHQVVELNMLYDMNADLKNDFAIENLVQNVLAVIGLFAIVFFIWVVIWI
jgi:hypothetical protein